MSLGDSAWNSGLKPLQHGDRARPRRAERDGGTRRQPPTVADALAEGDVALPDQVAVADERVGRAADRGLVGDGEGDQGPRALDDLHVGDRPDLHADAHVVALDHPGRVGEHRPVVAAGAEGEVADGHHEHRRGQRGDDHEDDQPDEVAGGPLVQDAHRRVTSGPPGHRPTTSSTPRSPTWSGSSRATARGATSAGRPRPVRRRTRRRRGSGHPPRDALAGRRVHAVVEVRLRGDRVALRPRRVGQLETGGAARLAVARCVPGAVPAGRWSGSVSSTMCSVKPRNASAWAAPALTMPPSRQGYSGAYFASSRSCAGRCWPSRMMLPSLSSRKVRAVSEKLADVLEQRLERRPRGPRGCRSS